MIVLHARALLTLATAEPLSDWVLTQVARDEVAAPAHQPVQVLAALDRLARSGVLDEAQLDEAVTAVVTLPQRLEVVDTPLVRRARALGPAVPFTDALHVALAERLQVPVVTTDPALALHPLRVEVLSPPPWLRPR